MDKLVASLPPPLRLPLPPEELVVEILLRLPPEPIYLLRASLVCKRWRRLVHDARFLRRFRACHGAPPVLGFFSNQIRGAPMFVRTAESFAASPPLPDPASWSVLDCRHGRALLFSVNGYPDQLLVWDPITGEKHHLGTPLGFEEGQCNGAVLCAPGHDDHGDCHSSPFLVAFVFTDDQDDLEATSACVYSSETGVWGDETSAFLPTPYVHSKRASHVGNSLYFEFNGNDILEFDLEGQSLHHIKGPYDAYIYKKQVLMPAEDGGLGVAALEGFSLHFWSRVAECDGVAKWTLRKIIDLKQFLPRKVVSKCRRSNTIPEAIGYSEDADVIFISIDYSGVYTIHLKSLRFEQVLNKESFEIIYPYSSFYIAGVSVGVGIVQLNS